MIATLAHITAILPVIPAFGSSKAPRFFFLCPPALLIPPLLERLLLLNLLQASLGHRFAYRLLFSLLFPNNIGQAEPHFLVRLRSSLNV